MVFEPVHDSKLLGPLQADPADTPLADCKLASVPDLVRFVMARYARFEMPRQNAVARMLAKMKAAPALNLAVFITRKDRFALRVDDSYEWRPTIQERKGSTHQRFVPGPAFNINRWGDDADRPRFATKIVKARPGDPGLFGAAGALQVLHDAWGDHADAKARTMALYKHASILEHLAIPERLAAEWFGYPISSKPTHVASPARPGMEGLPPQQREDLLKLRPSALPPPGLEGLAVHDVAAVELWGASTTADGRPLVRIANLVRLHVERCGLAVRQAADGVLAKISSDAAVLLFMLELGDVAHSVEAGELWRGRYPSGVERLQAREEDRRASALWNLMWSISDDECRARGIENAASASFYDFTQEEMEALPALPELQGRDGALELLHWCWGRQAKNRAALDDGPHAALAILETDAVRLFAIARQVDQLPDPLAIALDQAGAGGHSHDSADEWTDERVANRLAELKNQTPMRKAPMNDLLAEMGIEVNSANRRDVQRKVKAFSADRQPASLANAWHGRFVHRA